METMCAAIWRRTLFNEHCILQTISILIGTIPQLHPLRREMEAVPANLWRDKPVDELRFPFR